MSKFSCRCVVGVIAVVLTMGAVAVIVAMVWGGSDEETQGVGTQVRDDEWRKVEGYLHVRPGDIACQALVPWCGWCPGEVRGEECFVRVGSEEEVWADAEDKWILVDDFRYVEEGEVTCDALMPDCGWCPGEMFGRECFVRQTSEFCKEWGDTQVCWTPLRPSAGGMADE